MNGPDVGREATSAAEEDAFLARRIDALEPADREVLDRAAAILERMLEGGGE